MVFHPFLFPDAFLKETKPRYLFFNLTVRFSSDTFSPVLFPRCLKRDCLKTFDSLFMYLIDCIIADSVDRNVLVATPQVFFLEVS